MNDAPAEHETDPEATEPEATEGEEAQEVETVDTALRPECLADFVGQKAATDRLALYIRAALRRGDPLDHVLFSGPPGLGKTSLAYLIAKEMGDCRLVNVSGPTLNKPIDLVGTLTRLDAGDVLFIDELHRMPPAVEEYLYTAMEDWRIDVQSGDEGAVSLELSRFTLVGATTKEGMLTKPLLARFGIRERLNTYNEENLARIVMANAPKLEIGIETDAATAIARRSRGTPRNANRILRRMRDIAQDNELETITLDVAQAGLEILGIDENGLDAIDHRILSALAGSRRPIGIKNLAVQVGEEQRTIEDNHEPWLIAKGMIARTFRGREITEAGRIAIAGGLV